MSFFGARVEKVLQSRKAAKTLKLAKRFRDVMQAAQKKVSLSLSLMNPPSLPHCGWGDTHLLSLYLSISFFPRSLSLNPLFLSLFLSLT